VRQDANIAYRPIGLRPNEPGAAWQRPMILANPAADRGFRDQVDRVLFGGPRRPSELQAILRLRYPNAVVRRRELTDEDLEIWYVYRDGRWTRGAT